MRRLPVLLLASLLVFGSAAPAEEVTVRIASLLPSVEDALRGVDGVEVVAGVRRSFRAPERTDVIDLGSPHHPNVERLATARATLVVGDAQINGHLSDALARFGAEVVLIDTTSVEGTFAGLLELGARLGAADDLSRRVGKARTGLADQTLDDPVRVLALFGTPGSFQVVTERSWQGSLLAALGFENLATGLPGDERVPGFVSVGHEHLATLRPDLVLLVAHGDPRAMRRELEAKLSGDGPWGALGRSASRGVHVLPPDLFVANPGLDLPRAARALVELAGEAPPAVAAP